MTQTQIIGLIMYRTNMLVGEWAESKKLTRSTVYRVISGETKRGNQTEKIRKAISADVKEEVVAIWPDAAQTQ